jgi:hypothetical protein
MVDRRGVEAQSCRLKASPTLVVAPLVRVWQALGTRHMPPTPANATSLASAPIGENHNLGLH